MGPTDLLKPVVERHFDGTIHFGRVTIKPGKPTTFATIPTPGRGGEVKTPITLYQKQIAATLAALLGFKFVPDHGSAEKISTIIE